MVDIEETVVADQESVGWRLKARIRASRTEAVFLSILRYSVLLVAAIALGSTALFFGFGALQQIGRTAVEADPVALTSTDVAPEQQQKAKEIPEKSAQSKPGVSKAVKRATASLFQTKFKKFQRPDAKIAEKQIVDFVWTEDRISLFDELAGRLQDAEGMSLADTEAVMLNALKLTGTATAAKPFSSRLAAFRDAKKINVCNEEIRSRRRTISTWDTYSTNCPYWYESPIGCASTRVVSEPYSERICKMQYPNDVEEPAAQMAQAIEQYAVVAKARLDQAAILAEEATAANHSRKAEGREQIETSGKLFLGFLALMFLYLFVAMERHHRSLRQLLANTGAATTPPEERHG